MFWDSAPARVLGVLQLWFLKYKGRRPQIRSAATVLCHCQYLQVRAFLQLFERFAPSPAVGRSLRFLMTVQGVIEAIPGSVPHQGFPGRP